MIPALGTLEGHSFHELHLYVCRQIGEKHYVWVLSNTFVDGIYQIHMHKKNVTLVGEVVNLFESTTRIMGTIIIRTSSTK